MSSAVNLPNHTFTGQAKSSKRLTSIVHILSPETDNCPSWISGRERMTVENISWSISTKECCRPRRGWTRDFLVFSRTAQMITGTSVNIYRIHLLSHSNIAKYQLYWCMSTWRMPSVTKMNMIHTWNNTRCKKWLDENIYDIYEIRYLWKLSTDLWNKIKWTILQFQFKIHLNSKLTLYLILFLSN